MPQQQVEAPPAYVLVVHRCHIAGVKGFALDRAYRLIDGMAGMSYVRSTRLCNERGLLQQEIGWIPTGVQQKPDWFRNRERAWWFDEGDVIAYWLKHPNHDIGEEW